MTPESILELIGEVLELSWQAGGLFGASWCALGALWGRKKYPLSGSWALQEESQDRFQLSWGPTSSQNGARRDQNGVPNRVRVEKAKSQKKKTIGLTRKPKCLMSGASKNKSKTRLKPAKTSPQILQKSIRNHLKKQAKFQDVFQLDFRACLDPKCCIFHLFLDAFGNENH